MKRSGKDWIIVYHIGKNPIPVPFGDRYSHRYPGIDSGIFLADNPVTVNAHHGIFGTVHVFAVSRDIFNQCPGMKCDHVNEIVIPGDLWDKAWGAGKIKRIGKIDSKKMDSMLRDYAKRRTHFSMLFDPRCKKYAENEK